MLSTASSGSSMGNRIGLSRYCDRCGVAGFATAFQESYMSGFHLALLIAALVLLTAAVVANRFIPGRAHADEIHAAAAAREEVSASAG